MRLSNGVLACARRVHHTRVRLLGRLGDAAMAWPPWSARPRGDRMHNAGSWFRQRHPEVTGIAGRTGSEVDSEISLLNGPTPGAVLVEADRSFGCATPTL